VTDYTGSGEVWVAVIGDRVDVSRHRMRSLRRSTTRRPRAGSPRPPFGGSRRISSPVERYYGRFGLDRTYRRLLHDAGLRIAGVDGGDGDARVMRLADHPFYA
jgi:hypothetical protein